MWTHEPEGYDCPFCHLVAGGEGRWNTQADVVWRDAETTAFISPKWWVYLRWAEADERAPFAERLRGALAVTSAHAVSRSRSPGHGASDRRATDR